MTPSLPLSAVILVLSVATAAAGPCAQGRRSRCRPIDTTVDFSAVPAISKQIVADEPAAPLPVRPAIAPEPPAPYTGPTIGVAPLPHAATVGYKWSID